MDPPTSDRTLPISGACTLFYYTDLATADRWYGDVLGLERVRAFPGGAVFRLSPGSHLALIDGRAGSQRPIAGADKGVILSMETNDLSGWLEHLRSRGVVGPETRIVCGTGGLTEEFKLRDPEDYTLEFFRWIDPPAVDV